MTDTEIFQSIVDEVKVEKHSRRLVSRVKRDMFIELRLREHGFKKEDDYLKQQEAMCKIIHLLKCPEPEVMDAKTVLWENEPYVRYSVPNTR